MFAASGEAQGRDKKGRNSVSTLSLLDFNANLEDPMVFAYGANSAIKNDNYEKLKEQFLKKYNKRSKSDDIKKEVQNLFHADMKEAYEKLSNIAVVIIGDGVGKYTGDPFCGPGNGPGEVLYKRVNIRIIAVDGEDNKIFIQELIQSITPELAQTIAFFTIQEMERFEEKREKYSDGCYSNLFVCDFVDSFNSRLPFKFDFNKVKEVENKEVFLYKKLFSKKSIDKYGYDEVSCEQTKTRAITTSMVEDELTMRKLIESANTKLAETTALLTTEEIEEYTSSNGDIYNNVLPVKFSVMANKIPVKYYIKSSVPNLEDINSKKAILDAFQKAHEYYNKAIEFYKGCNKEYCEDLLSAEKFHRKAILGFYFGNKEDIDLVKNFNITQQDRGDVKKEQDKVLEKIEKDKEISTKIKVY